MSIEEVKVFRDTLNDYILDHTNMKEFNQQVMDLTTKVENLKRSIESYKTENERLINGANELRESEANALNENEELRHERDDARRKLFEWARFINFVVYENLNSAVKSKRCRPIVKEMVDAMRDFQNKNPLTLLEVGMAK